MSMTIDEAYNIIKSNNNDNRTEQNPFPTQEDIIMEINKDYAMVKVGSRIKILHEETDHEGLPVINYLSVQDFKTKISNRFYYSPAKDGLKKCKAFDAWLESDRRREYKGVVFAPGQTLDSDYYNTYQGFTVKPKPGSWKKLRHHIFVNICRRNRKIYRYLIAWMAKLFQDPGGERTGVVIVLRGRQGTGKGIFVGALGKLLGAHYLQLNNQSQVTGKFNRHLESILLLFVDESFFAGDKQAASTLKGQITEPYIQIEPKGVDSYTAKNYLHIMMASNNDWVVPAGLEERRFLILDVSDDQIQNHKYFKDIMQELENGGYEAMLHDLLKHKYAHVNLRHAPPTEGLLDQIVSSMDSVHLFWFNVLCAGDITIRTEDMHEETIAITDGFISCDALFNAYHLFITQQREHYPLSKAQFGKNIYRLFPPRSKNRKQYNGSYQRGYIFNSLADCREYFAKLIKAPINWSSWASLTETEENTIAEHTS